MEVIIEGGHGRRKGIGVVCSRRRIIRLRLLFYHASPHTTKK